MVVGGREPFVSLGCYLSSLTFGTTVTENRQILTVTLMDPPFLFHCRLSLTISQNATAPKRDLAAHLPAIFAGIRSGANRSTR